MRRRFLKICQNQPLDLYKSESPSSKNVSYKAWMKLAWWFLRRSHLKEKLTPDNRPAPWHKLSWPVARWAKKWFCIQLPWNKGEYNNFCYIIRILFLIVEMIKFAWMHKICIKIKIIFARTPKSLYFFPHNQCPPAIIRTNEGDLLNL